MSWVSVGVLLVFDYWCSIKRSVHTAGVSALKGTCDFIRRGTEWANRNLATMVIIWKLLDGEKSPPLDIVLMNAAAALVAAGPR